jgi:hypothetical protein
VIVVKVSLQSLTLLAGDSLVENEQRLVWD